MSAAIENFAAMIEHAARAVRLLAAAEALPNAAAPEAVQALEQLRLERAAALADVALFAAGNSEALMPALGAAAAPARRDERLVYYDAVAAPSAAAPEAAHAPNPFLDLLGPR